MPQANWRNFTLAFRVQWFAAMSGGASVPFTALAIFLDNRFAQAIFAMLAFTSVWFAAFRIWKPERQKVLELEEKQKPKLKLQGFKERYEVYNLHGFLRHFDLDILNDSAEQLNNCLVKVLKIEATDGTIPYTKDLPVALQTQRNSERDGGGPFNLRAGENKIVRLCSRVDGEQRELEFCYERSEPHWAYSLRDTHDCEVTIGIYGAPAPSVEHLRIKVAEDGKLTVARRGD